MRSVRVRSAALIVILALSAPAAWGAPAPREDVVQVPWEYDTSEGFNVHRLTRDDLVRTDTMAMVPGFDPARIVDAPPVIDKRDFRRLQSNDYAPDRLFVRFKPGRGDGAKSAAHRIVGAEVLTESPAVPDLALVRLAPGIAVGKAIHQYLDRDEVLYAEPLYDATLSAVPNDPNWGTSGACAMGRARRTPRTPGTSHRRRRHRRGDHRRRRGHPGVGPVRQPLA